MSKKHKVLHQFYKSDSWKEARRIKILSVNGKCENCGSFGEEVHHVIKLTPYNVTDTNISLNQKNLKFLCKNCHNKEHGRFIKDTQFDEEGNLRLY